MRLTTFMIQSLKPSSTGRKTYFDDRLGGFGIRVSQRSKTFGQYPTPSLKEARKEAQAFVTVPRQLDKPNLGYSEATERF